MGHPVTKPSTVYAIQCKANGKVYVGCTINWPQRVKEHFRDLDHQMKARHGFTYRVPGAGQFQDDYNKYGKDGFVVFIVEEGIPPEDRKTREAYYIKKYRSTEAAYGYNILNEQPKVLGVEVVKGEPRINEQ